MSNLYINDSHHMQGEQTALGVALEEDKWKELRREVRACQITINTECNPSHEARALIEILGARTVTIDPRQDGHTVTGKPSPFAGRMIDKVIEMACDNKQLSEIQEAIDEYVWEEVQDDEQSYRRYN